MKKVMIDLETLGTEPGCVVLSIGAVAFDETGPLLEHGEFHARLDVEIQHAVGLKTDPSTALFWVGQSDEARKSLLYMQPQRTQIALADLAEWMYVLVDEVDGPVDVEVWGKGANFDPPILRELYKAMGIECPWNWWNERCFRTEEAQLKTLVERVTGERPVNLPRSGVHHDALADAKYQAENYASLHRQVNAIANGEHRCEAVVGK